ncbi:MAG: hypothetical protein WD942_07035 [Dehalococcoidia bacterium]
MTKLLKLLLAGTASLAVALGASGASAALPKGGADTPPMAGSQSAGEVELASLLLKEAKDAPPTVLVASRFKAPGQKGRPEIFGPPGKPVIGPPGQSGY